MLSGEDWKIYQITVSYNRGRDLIEGLHGVLAKSKEEAINLVKQMFDILFVEPKATNINVIRVETSPLMSMVVNVQFSLNCFSH